MIDQLIQQLQSPDPQQRRQAIIALGKESGSGGAEASRPDFP